MFMRVVYWLLISAAVASIAVWAVHSRDMRRSYERIRGRSSVIPSPYGEIEYAVGGSGLPVLVIHGSGGGFDQGELIARAVLGEGTRWIAPSRFGYLRSTFRQGATFDEQAHAYAFLLDHLRIERVAVIALSHGGPSALLFAVLHPDRVASLTLVSAGVASSTDATQARANRQGAALTAIFQGDFRYWAVTTALRGRFLELMGAPPAIVARLTPGQRRLADQVIDFMNPVSPRARGVTFDNRAAMPDERIAGVRAPTLIIHARDDTLQLYRNAEFAAARIPGSRLVSFERGGHLVLAVEQPRIRELVAGELLATTPDAGEPPAR
jgi:pimeloyl-ACP methyl ester carboxylesterase